MKKCPTCGSEVADSEDTCGVCGNPLNPEAFARRARSPEERTPPEEPGEQPHGDSSWSFKGMAAGLVLIVLGVAVFWAGYVTPGEYCSYYNCNPAKTVPTVLGVIFALLGLFITLISTPAGWALIG